MAQERIMVVLALDGSLADAFVAALAGTPVKSFQLSHPDGELLIKAVGSDSIPGEVLVRKLADIAGVIVVAQHMDAISMEALRKLVARLPQDDFVPQAFALHREPDRPEFKISCGSCGQKLWVSDAHEGRPGRCPGCKQSFMIPSQERHFADSLQLPPEAPVRILERGDTDAAVALVNDLAARLAERIEATNNQQKNSTMRIVIDPEALR